ncbi:protein SMAX1-LIKE 3-like [Salvia miltiorrhiza]|uniref:protein SMAX1-LIKE 3-like n=1 Tax=Salvia miltiorrhiza TaxID=226208 RepID=UPI0025ABA375|nr:protein SMAX1-LIKE 3-like [Salvia miltiorrhiza]
MRASGNCAVQQGLTAEAGGVVKQALVLAKRRGHAQVTPLHVANTMLAAAGGIFRVACLDSHSHPLQCKALELCFNVALNRLPAASTPHHPSISNALVAAFKRAQAHQRRGSTDSQQQPLLAVKIELEQLIISILDDPSVSRVMREAGFSSTQVKINVEKAISLQLGRCSPPPPTSKQTLLSSSSPPGNEDLDAIIDTLLMRKSVALVGESTSNLEATVKGVMDRVERGEVPESLREVKFISIPPFCNLRRDQVELKIRELTRLVQSLVGRGVVLYLGDLKWISDYRAGLERQGSYYCAVEHMIMEIGRLVWGIGEMERFWLMGIATFQTYMSCRNGHHSLWGLHPLTIPVNSLAFTLVSHSDEKSESRRGTRAENEEMKLSCCVECWEKFQGEARDLQASANDLALSRLPSWLKDESRRLNDKDQKCEAMNELCKKWKSLCSSAHKQGSSSSAFLSAPNSGSSGDAMDSDGSQKLKEFNAENLNVLCNALEEKVRWQKEIIPEIAGTILQCRSGMVRRKSQSSGKEETWLLFVGADEKQAKEKIARELAKLVFGSYSSFASIGLSSFVDSSPRNKRGRDECKSYIDRFAAAVAADPRRVFLVEDLEQADYCSQMGIKRAIEKGRIVDQNGDEVGLADAIVVFSCESFRSSSVDRKAVSGAGEEGAGGGGAFLDLNMSFEDDDGAEVDDLGILQNVDRRVVFKIQNFRQ